MTNFWEDLKNNITEWSIVASEKAEEFTHTSKLRIDVLQLERKLSSQYVKLGLYVFSKTKEKNVLNFVGDKKYLSIIDSIETIKIKIVPHKSKSHYIYLRFISTIIISFSFNLFYSFTSAINNRFS